MYYVYVLQSLKNNQLYIGYSEDLKRRFEEHNTGKNISTKPYAPWKIVFYEAHLNQLDALIREKYLKTSQGSRAIKKMLREQLKEGKITL